MSENSLSRMPLVYRFLNDLPYPHGNFGSMPYFQLDASEEWGLPVYPKNMGLLEGTIVNYDFWIFLAPAVFL